MLRNEYIRFMQLLGTDDALKDVRKLANIVHAHLNEIIPLGTAHSRRSQKIVELALNEFEKANTECAISMVSAKPGSKELTKLASLTVGPFRGFSKQEVFDLSHEIVLIYGPNGTGKSSFCEALEFGLLGSVEEADTKRFREPRDYLKNAHTGQFVPPEITAIFSDGSPATVVADESAFRFCFIEKNRIDNFARIAAHLPARQTTLISTLFGLESFNDFVRGFSSELDERHIDLSGRKAAELANKQKSLESDKRTILDSQKSLDQLTLEEKEIANQFQRDMAFGDFVLSLGTTDKPGEIQSLETELQEPLPTLSGLKLSDLYQARDNVLKAIDELANQEKRLAENSEGISYKQLYQAILALNTDQEKVCPACKTPLEQTMENPFEAAQSGLSKLAHLSALEYQRDEQKADQHRALRAIHDLVKRACDKLGNEIKPNPLHDFLVTDEALLSPAWWQSLVQPDDKGECPWNELERQSKELESLDKEVLSLQEGRRQKITRLKELRQFSEQVIQLQTRRRTLDEAINKAKLTIAEFDEKNKTLFEDVEHEKKIVEQNKIIATAYLHFVRRLNRYMEALPGKLVADLGQLVVQLYNAFNRADAHNDLLGNLKLPASAGDRIQISFNSDPNKYFDALHVLSEGHIRCVGLAILLAKNLKENCPFLIFDDPINAIDEDHREGIRRTLFEDDYFKDKQIILACHGEEFFKDIQNLIGNRRAKLSKCLTFLPQLGDKKIRIDFQSTPRNYLVAAEKYYNKLETRAALEKARQTLESLTKEKIWRYVAKHGGGDLRITLRGPKASIELRNLTEQLRSKLTHASFTHEHKDLYLQPITSLLGYGGDSREWRYLNKGVHEEADRSEFDRMAVKDILDALINLDSAPN